MKTQTKKQLKEKAQKLLSKPGVYRMLDKDGNLLYIGKSKALDKRVASYFTNTVSERSKKIERMIRQINDFEVYYTDTELDALLLECQWIQQQKPPYNTMLTRTGRYRYFEIDGTNPYVLKLRRVPQKKAQLRIGPFPHKQMARNAYEFIKNYYPEFFPASSYVEKLSLRQGVERDYGDALVSFQEECLKKDGVMIKKLEKQMQECSERWAYEEAAKVLISLQGLKYLQYIYDLITTTLDEEVIGVLPIEGSFFYKYYRISGGRIIKRMKGTKIEEAKIIKQLKKIKVDQMTGDEKEAILVHEIDPIQIIQSFKRKGMRILKV